MKGIALKIARVLVNVASKEEIEAVSRWGEKSDINTSFINNLRKFWDGPPEQVPQGSLGHARTRLLVRMGAGEKKGKKSLFPSYIAKVAAAIVFIVSIAGLSVYIASETNLFYRGNGIEISTEAGQRSKVALPDGSMVWLNAETVVKYCPDKKTRRVSLSGEAYFEVSHSQDYPFVVEAGGAKIKVLGTKFNVSHFPGSLTTKASLLTGGIEMSSDIIGRSVKLNPGRKLIYNEKEHTFTEMQTNVQDEILWTKGVLVFENELFDELILRLERHYAVKFIYNKNVFKDTHYTGTIDNLSVDRVLEFINLTIPVNYEINNKTIELSLREK